MKRIFNGSGGRKAALILSLCLIFALAVGTTVALLVAHTNAVTNTFMAAKSGTDIVEELKDNQKKSIKVENTGTATSYVRVKLVMNWVDNTTGNIVSGDNLPEVTLNEADWFEKGGIYYYKMPVAPVGEEPNNVTSNLRRRTRPSPSRQRASLRAATSRLRCWPRVFRPRRARLCNRAGAWTLTLQPVS